MSDIFSASRLDLAREVSFKDAQIGALETRIEALEKQVAELYRRLDGDGR